MYFICSKIQILFLCRWKNKSSTGSTSSSNADPNLRLPSSNNTPGIINIKKESGFMDQLKNVSEGNTFWISFIIELASRKPFFQFQLRKNLMSYHAYIEMDTIQPVLIVIQTEVIFLIVSCSILRKIYYLCKHNKEIRWNNF